MIVYSYPITKAEYKGHSVLYIIGSLLYVMRVRKSLLIIIEKEMRG